MQRTDAQPDGPMTVARPLVMLAAGALAAVVAWHVLMSEPARPGALEAVRREQLSTGDRRALEAVLRQDPDVHVAVRR